MDHSMGAKGFLSQSTGILDQRTNCGGCAQIVLTRVIDSTLHSHGVLITMEDGINGH